MDDLMGMVHHIYAETYHKMVKKWIASMVYEWGDFAENILW